MGRPKAYKSGDKIGFWTVLEAVPGPGKYRCSCICGAEVIHRFGGKTGSQSCGCQRGPLLSKSYADKRARGVHHPSRKHGLSQTGEYQSYKHMLRRCLNPKDDSYHLYGARGITIDPRWLGPEGFVCFLSDLGKRPAGTSLDRIDPDGNYEPTNCRWADAKTQIANRRTVVQVSVARLRRLEEIARKAGEHI